MRRVQCHPHDDCISCCSNDAECAALLAASTDSGRVAAPAAGGMTAAASIARVATDKASSGSMGMACIHTPSRGWHCYECVHRPLPVYTCWMALGPVTRSDGTLCFVPGSHTWTGFDRPRPATAQVPSEFAQRLREDRSRTKSKGKGRGMGKGSSQKTLACAAPSQTGVHWCGTDYQPGDVVIFNVKTVHAASSNTSDSFRLRYAVHRGWK